ncbi:ExbD/TolR family protein [Janthinobacterium agaricidamnosum]|uniref:Biopolymer transport ExbD/TolR family protein n=1 Tax=Janthinobacterium agaricidamnosum NBRC 102515 = DSM 9628 TaxID=1349767 RepID=W0V0E0_9BURK|nr:biopolymer transporter ExbD [Janthinobacterium agaricidamnosum]CDG81060.1 biopolymer transport ExbD/TolR family protein [Janthinobacterium agaricidamnosum NBRC 102515 = DSM 9628]
MAFGSFSKHQPQPLMADINVTPMVDVMLVLLVIFIIAAPVLTQALQLDLPQVQPSAASQPAAVVSVSIDRQGRIFWNNVVLAPEELGMRLQQAATLAPQPTLQLRADKDTRYEVVARVMAQAQSSGLSRLAFVTDAVEASLQEKK